MPTSTPDGVVIGGGAVGLAVARRLSSRGLRVVLLERGGGGAASPAAAGMLAPQVEANEPDAFFELLRRARDGWEAFAREVEDVAGLEIDYRRDGALAVEGDLAGESALARRAEWQRAAGQEVEELEAPEASRRWPGLELPRPACLPDEAPAEGRLFHFPREAQVDAGRLVEALLAACRADGVDVRLGSEAVGLLRAGGRVTGVRTTSGTVSAALVVNAAGAWADAVASWAGEVLPVEPVRGEMAAYATSGRPPRPIVVSAGAYCLLRADGRLLVGATAERAGYDADVTPEGQAWLERRAALLAPRAAASAPTERWAGLRPGTPDGLPVIGASSELEGLVHATGHYRNGILLAPITADLVAELVTGAELEAVADAFRPARWAASELRR